MGRPVDFVLRDACQAVMWREKGPARFVTITSITISLTRRQRVKGTMVTYDGAMSMRGDTVTLN